MTINEKITTLLEIAKEIDSDIEKAQNFDSDMLNAFELAQAKAKESASCLRKAQEQIVRLREQANKIALFNEEPQDSVERPTLHGWFFLQPVKGEYFNSSTYFGRELVRLGAPWGVTFKEGEPIVQVLFLTNRDDINGNDGCWQNGDVPQQIINAVGTKMVPSYLPLSMVNAIVVDQKLTLHAKGADVVFDLCPQGCKGDKTLEEVRDAVVTASGF